MTAPATNTAMDTMKIPYIPAAADPRPAIAGMAKVDMILPPLNEIPEDRALNFCGNNSV